MIRPGAPAIRVAEEYVNSARPGGPERLAPAQRKALIAGGAGFIGSTVASACLDGGITPVILDNLSTGRVEFARDRIFYRGDIADGQLVARIFAEHPEIEATIHCAALIVVPDSVAAPLRYYRENVAKSVDFVESVIASGCGRFLFSSSASIYGPGADFAVDEASPVAPTSPYGHSKAMLEQILQDCSRAYPFRVISLRYFNPVGADPAMRTGLQLANPAHAMGKLVEAARTGGSFCVTGTDWPTRDGSGVRDYVHVWDLARAHLSALRLFDTILPPEAAQRDAAIDLGTGDGTTVWELVSAFEKVLGRSLDVNETPVRPGDSAGSYTRSRRSWELLGWRPTLSIEDSIRHSLQWSAIRDTVLQNNDTPQSVGERRARPLTTTRAPSTPPAEVVDHFDAMARP